MMVACAPGVCHSRHLLSGIHLVVSAEKEQKTWISDEGGRLRAEASWQRWGDDTDRGVFTIPPTLFFRESDRV